MQKREIAVEVALENIDLRRSLDDLSRAAFVMREYVDNFGKWPPASTKIAKDFNGALSAAFALLGRENVDAA